MKVKRLLSLCMAFLLLASTCFVALPKLSVTADGGTAFIPEEYDIDFSEYKVIKNNDGKNGTVWAGYGTDYLKKMTDDATATGGAYLRHQMKTHNANNVVDSDETYDDKADQMTRHQFTVNKTGEGLKTDDPNALVLKANTNYRVKICYRVNQYENIGSRLDIRLSYTNNNTATTGQTKYTLAKFSVKGTTNGWVEETLEFKTPEKFYNANDEETTFRLLLIAVYPFDESYSYDKDAAYIVDFDNVEVEKLATVTLTSKTDDKITETIVETHDTQLPPYARTYYTDKNNTETKVDITSKTLGDFNGMTLYYEDNADAFTPEDYDIDFSEYKVIKNNDGKNGTVWAGYGTDYLKKMTDDATATGGAYLRHQMKTHNANNVVDSDETYDDKADQMTRHQFTVNKTGEGLKTDDPNALVLKANTNYRVKIRYRVNQYENIGSRLDIRLSYTNNNTATTGQTKYTLAKFSVKGTTNGWVEETLEFKTPEKFYNANDAETTFRLLLIAVYPFDESYSYDKDAAYIVDFDYVQVDRTSCFELYDGTKNIGEQYGAPGETLSVANIKNPTKSGYRFAGWYSDPELTEAVSNIYFVAGNVSGKLYASWQEAEKSAEVDADTYPENWKSDVNIYSGIEYSADTYSGTNSFKTISDAYMRIYGKSNTPFIAVKGNKYLVSFMYKSASDFDVALVTADENNINNSQVVGVQKTVTASSDWKQVFIPLQCNDIVSGNETLYFKVIGAGVIIDDIKISSTSKIHFETNGAEPMDDIEGNLGEAANPLVPNYEGHSFSGWYYDADLERKCTNPTFPTDTDVITLYAAWDLKEPTAFMDFEDTTVYSSLKSKSGGGNYLGDYFSYTGADVFDGNYSLNFNFTGGNKENAKNKNSFAVYVDGDDGKEVLRSGEGVTYAISFYYKVKSAETDIRVMMMTAYRKGNQSNYNAQDYKHSDGITISKDEAGGEWKKAVIYVISKPKTNNDLLCDSMYIYVSPREDKDVELLIDNVTVDRFSEDEALLTLSVDSNNKEYYRVNVGDKVTLPTPSKDNYVFGSWCSNSSYTKTVDTVYTVTGNTVLYAKWHLVSTVMTFDDYPTAWTEKTDSVRARFSDNVYITDLDGNKVLEFKGKNWSTAVAQMYEAGTTNLIQAKSDCYYMFTFKYMVKSGAAKLEFVTAGANNGHAKPFVQKTYEINSFDTGVWKETTCIFKITPSDYSTFHFKFTANVDNTDILIDDVKFELLQNVSIVQFVTNNGEEVKPLIGNEGESFTCPSLKRNGYYFGGWYTDAGLTESFKTNQFSDGFLTLYAKWIVKEKLVVDFEDDFYTTIKSGQKYTMERTDKHSYRGNYSILMNKGDEVKGKKKNAYILLSYDNLPIELENNRTYVITYRYKAIKNSDYTAGELNGQAMSVKAKTAAIDSGWSKAKTISGKHTLGIEQDLGVWMTGSYTISTDFADPEGRYLYFAIDYSDTATYCFDYITVEKVSRSSNDDFVLHLNPLQATDIGDTQLWTVNKTGTEVTLPTNLKRNGYTFYGWYEDPKLTKKVEGNSYKILYSDKTLYAGWVKNKITQDFENVSDIFIPEGIVYLDQDFEVYNSTNGSKENVISGKYSIHRKGEEFRFSAFSPLVSGDGGTGTLVLGAGYRITMWVKIDKHSHEDGAIEIATCNAEKYSWSVVGNWKKIAAVKDLADGEWHQISFDFITSGKFLSIKVPGNLSVYFDDVELEYLPGLQASDCSKEVEVTEYVPMRYSESKTFLNSELDEGLFKLTGGSIIANLTAGNVILVCVAVIVVGALAVTVCVVLRKKRKGAEK